MIKKISHAWFADPSYALIYTHLFFHNIASSVMYVFTGAWFLKLGMPLPFVLLFYGLEFGVRGALSPWGLILINRLGMVKALFLSSFFFILFFLGVSFSGQNLFVGFFSLFFAAAAGGIYYPLLDVLEALYVEEDHNRGRQMTLGMILGSLGSVVGAVSTGFCLQHYGFGAVVVIASVSMILSVLPFLKLRDAGHYIENLKTADVLTFFVSDEFRPLWKPFFGEQLMIIVSAIMVPVFIYTLVGKMDSLGYLIAMALILEKIFTLTAGHYIDKIGRIKMMNFSMFIYSLGMLGFITLVQTPLSAFFAESYNKIACNIFNGAYRSAIHIHVREKHPRQIMLFGAAWQMALCFGELLVLPFYALLAYFIGMNVFYIACAAAAAGLYLVVSYFNEPLKKDINHTL